MSNKPVPDVLAMVICDQIISDRLTGKQSIIGMFSKINALRFPATHPQLSIFVALTGGHGKTAVRLRIVDANDERPPLVEGNGTVDFADPRAIANLVLQFHGLTFPQPGEYRVQLLSNTTLLREARLDLVQTTPPRKREEEGGQSTGFIEPLEPEDQ